MPYDPGIAYRGDQYTYQGITGAAGAIAGGIEDWAKKHQETMQKLNESGVLMDYAAKKGYVTPDQITKYAAANANQKADMGAALAKTIVLDQQDAEKKAEMANAIAVANIHAAAARAAAAGEPGMSLDFINKFVSPAAEAAGYRVIPQPAKGGGFKVQALPYQSGGDEGVDTNTIYAKPVPGTGTGPDNPVQHVMVGKDKSGKEMILKNTQIQGLPRPADPNLGLLMGLLGGGGLGGGSTFGPSTGPAAPPAAPAPTATPVPFPPGVGPNVPAVAAATPTPAPVAPGGATVAKRFDDPTLQPGELYQAPDGSIRRARGGP